MIDPRAIIDPSAVIGDDVEIGPWTTIGPDVEIGAGSHIASHVVIKGPTRLGCNNRIYQFASLGEATPALIHNGEPAELLMGDNNVIREGVTIHRGTVQVRGKTAIGDGNLLMSYVHIGHDCILGDHIIMANTAIASAGVSIGNCAEVGGLSLLLKDVPAYVSALGNPARAVGMNVEGMQRQGCSEDTIAALRKAYRALYQRGLLLDEAIAELRELARSSAEVRIFADSIQASVRGVVPVRGDEDADD